ncbi:oxidoreductase [Haliscomenobacter hydrossis]|uniref:Short-chain dehydrogenase/reductase SDR n=1 Tax=Haliscomenobacter hydrossis (strain ATCC 27775 / DSM 1100 / LMG 10767 / O) TaxID=760192 RepID=F4L0F2_HALH1|nr:oxidoreductase [Haliscomenobacter hydrossis]AEE48464.1 short-chain dehydrogenase/reductase SDR [Haliscomenobacter hydrossis DSM 1100]
MNEWNLAQYPSQQGKVAIITGANSGIGFEAALQLAKKDMMVILACRRLDAAEKAKEDILKSYPTAQVTPMKIDLSSLREVREFAENFQHHFDRLDLLINNAGIMMSPYKETEDGFENQLATNFLGHFALTGRLMQLLMNTPESRIITLSSLSYKWASINFDDLHFRKSYNKKKAYGQSKRACLVFAYELNRRLSASGKTTISLGAHPGLSNTNLDRYFSALIRPFGILFLQSPMKGALPILYAALNEELKGGEYIGPDGFQEMRGNPTIVDSDEATKDQKIANKLWKVAEEITGVQYTFN